MFSGLQEDQLKGALEAMLFVTDEPVGTIALADMLEVEPAEVERALVDLRAQLEEENRGIQLREVAGGWRLATHPAYHELIERYVLSWDTRKLSQAAMETLAIVAYSQPVTRAGVASVRGVNSDSSLNSLVEKGLVREAARPTRRATRRSMPRRARFWRSSACARWPTCLTWTSSAPDDDTRAFIRERLSATRDAAGRAVEGGEPADVLDGLVLDEDGEPEPVTLSAQLEGSDGGAAAPLSALDEAASAAAEGTPFLSLDDASAEAAQNLLADAMAQGLGVVEKIDFDKLTFETDDE